MMLNHLTQQSWLRTSGIILLMVMSLQILAVYPVQANTNNPIGECLSTEEAKLAEMVNAYRQDNGLAAVPVSKSLVTVAQYHVVDLQTYRPDQGTDDRGLACNMHSWSANGPWSPVCYTSDHEYASGMWDKPDEITNGIYTSAGFENAYRSTAGATAEGALTGWQNSKGHNDVILNKEVWATITFRAMGVGIYDEYAVLWFGQQTDPQGTLNECGAVSPEQSDVNNDGRVSPLDAIYVVNRLGSSDLSADVNQDGFVTANDVQLIGEGLGTVVSP